MQKKHTTKKQGQKIYKILKKIKHIIASNIFIKKKHAQKN